MPHTVYVKNIPHDVSEEKTRDFFSFCGKVSSISLKPETDEPKSTQTATVTFDHVNAANTALLLDRTYFGSEQIQITAAHDLDEIAKGHTTTADAVDDSVKTDREYHINQEDKPRSRIIAEYLAHGYTIGDIAIKRAIDLDHKHGVSQKFTAALHNFDSKYKATDKARAVDANYGVSDTANAGWQSIHSYFEKALETPTGQRVRQFYTQSTKQVVDIHNEARRLADLKKSEGESSTGSKLEETPGKDLSLHL
jgi:hypothetical protein